MAGNTAFKAGIAAILVALYVGLFHVSGMLAGNEAFGGVASIFFLPAFVRLLGFLVIGYWAIPALFLAALPCVDLGLNIADRAIVAAFLATGAPLGIALAAQLCKLRPSLSNLTPLRLLWLSIGSSLGNAIFYHLGLNIVGHGAAAHLATFIGDAAGTWAVIYAIKAALTLRGHKLGT